MYFKQKNISPKAYKILSVVLALAVLISGVGVWYNFVGTSSTVNAAVDMPDKAVVNSDFFDYYYDNEINSTIWNYSQGDRKRPYNVFNTAIAKSDYANGSSSSTTTISTFTFTVNTSSWNDKPNRMAVHIWEDGGAVLFNWQALTATDSSNNYWSWTLDYDAAKRVKDALAKGAKLKFVVRANGTDLQKSGDITYNGTKDNYAYNIEVNANTGWSCTQTKSTQTVSKTIGSSTAVPLYFGQFWIEGEKNVYTQQAAGNQTAANYGTNTNKQSDTGMVLPNFWWGANLAFRPLNETPGAYYAQHHAVAQGLVDKTLTYENDTLVPTKDGQVLPYFSKEWINNTKYSSGQGNNINFTTGSSGKAIADYTEDVDFTFSKKHVNQTFAGVETNGDFYVFDSANDSVYLDKETGKLATNTNPIYDTQDKKGFFPYNNTNSDDKSLNYGLGIRFDIPFNISEHGTVDDTVVGNAVQFVFKGDDDVWVFLDGVLVLDLGGAHKEAEGVIDFKKKEISVGYVADAKTNNIQSDNVSSLDIKTNKVTSFEELGIGRLSTGEHTITMYYMERGMINSNLYVQFNMSVIPNENTLTVQNAVNADNVNPGLINQTYAVADDDVFQYQIANKGTSSGDVTSSGILYPTQNLIKRENQDIVTLLSKPTAESHYDNQHLYLDVSQSGWNKYNTFGAWIWATGKSGKLIRFTYDDATKKYKSEDLSSYTNANDVAMDLIVFTDGNFPTNINTYPSTTNKYAIGNSGKDIPVNLNFNNLYTLTSNLVDGWNNASEYTGWRILGQQEIVTNAPTESDFDPDSITGEYKPVKNTNYAMSDPFAYIKGAVWQKYTQTVAGRTDNNGALNLMYNESAKFTGQFKKGSSMQVIQNDTLNKPTRSSDEVVTFNSGNRKVSNYYTTTVALAGSSDTQPDSNNRFVYDSSTADKVHIVETFTNTVKTGDLTIIKNVAKGDKNTAGTFTFKITLNNLFGSTTSVTDYSGINYKLYDTKDGDTYITKTLGSDGTFTMGPNQKAVIEGIPVGTKYEVTESLDNNYKLVNNGVAYANTNKTITVDTNDNVTVTNERKTGTLYLKKDVRDSNGTNTNVTDEDKKTSFTFKVELTNPQGVKIYNNYILFVNGSNSSIQNAVYQDGKLVALENEQQGLQDGDGVIVTVDEVSEQEKTNNGEAVVVNIPNIPYGTTYKVYEQTKEGWTVMEDQCSGLTGTISAENAAPTATIVNRKKILDAYLTIVKCIDSLYYDSNDNPHGFQDGYSIIGGNNTTLDEHGYLKYTNAEQVFTFEVKEYDGATLVGTYQVLLKFPANSTRLSNPLVKDGVAYDYAQSKVFKVKPGHKYEITETNTSNGFSWRYDFAGADGFGITNHSVSGKTVTLTYDENATAAQNATARFWDKRNDKSKTIEGDMSSVTNDIKKAA